MKRFLEIIVVLVMLGLVSLAVYTESHNRAVVSKATPTPAPTPSPSVRASPSPSPSPSPSSSPGPLLTVTQWGVSLPASGTLANLHYGIVGDATIFYTTELYPKYSLCGPNGSGLGALSRVQVSADRGTAAASKVGTFNGYNYYYAAAQQPCVQGPPAASADPKLEEAQHNALAAQMKQMTLRAAQP